ncbi:MAG: 5-oxoprolinase subunit PxpA [Pyrinomonadaceae bacterium]
MKRIDLNCDLGEWNSDGSNTTDAQIMPFISSANIACGIHAGTPHSIKTTIELAIKHQVAIGAHPSYPDRAGFGRKSIKMNPEAIFELVLNQIETVNEICREYNIKLHHVKPHGALYNDAAENPSIAKAIVKAVKQFDKSSYIYALSGSALVFETEKAGMRAVSEVFADRTYDSEGFLVHRSQPNAMIATTKDSIRQVLMMANEGCAQTLEGGKVYLDAETVCLHGDSANASEFAFAINNALIAAGFAIASPK